MGPAAVAKSIIFARPLAAARQQRQRRRLNDKLLRNQTDYLYSTTQNKRASFGGLLAAMLAGRTPWPV